MKEGVRDKKGIKLSEGGKCRVKKEGEEKLYTCQGWVNGCGNKKESEIMRGRDREGNRMTVNKFNVVLQQFM